MSGKWQWEQQRVLLTGGNSGLGEEIARYACGLGARCAIVARDQNRLDQITNLLNSKACSDQLVTSFKFDLSNPSEVPSLYEGIVESWNGQHPTILVNNAGYNAAGFVANTPINIYEHNYAVNLFSAIALIQCVLPDMVKHKHGGIVNIVSAAMYHSFPGISSYCSSKFALGAIHESLEAETALDGIQTLYVNPGGFKSRYWENLDSGGRLKTYVHPKRTKDRHPKNVAPRIFYALERGDKEVDLSGLIDKAGKYINFFCPSLFKKLLIKRNMNLLENRPFTAN